MLSSEEDLKKMNDERIQKKIAILKCQRFWREQTNVVNLRTNSLKGHVNYDVEWGYLYENDYQICKKKNECTKSCKHRDICKLYVIKTNEGVCTSKKNM